MTEYSNVHGDYGIRSATHEEVASQIYSCEHCWLLCRVSTGEVLAWDGGEPEDQLLVRDWKWVPQLLDAEVRRAVLCLHSDTTVLSPTTKWCRVCGALQTDGTWALPSSRAITKEKP